MKVIETLKKYFERDGGRKLTMDELKDLKPSERRELAELAAVELGIPLEKS